MSVEIGSKLLRDPEADSNLNPRSNLLVGCVQIESSVTFSPCRCYTVYNMVYNSVI